MKRQKARPDNFFSYRQFIDRRPNNFYFFGVKRLTKIS
jgi:hypothetical protein